MNAPNRTSGNWPDRIYYVCNSGSGIVVNAALLVQTAGPRRRIVGRGGTGANPGHCRQEHR